MNKDKINIRFLLVEHKDDASSNHYSDAFDLATEEGRLRFLDYATAIYEDPEHASMCGIFAPGK